jgi:hypothetical protein
LFETLCSDQPRRCKLHDILQRSQRNVNDIGRGGGRNAELQQFSQHLQPFAHYLLGNANGLGVDA